MDMTIGRAALATGRHRAALRLAADSGRLPARRVGRHYLVNSDDVAQYVLRNPSKGGVAIPPVDSLMGLALARARDLGHRMTEPEADTENSRVASCRNWPCPMYAVADTGERPMIYGGAVHNPCVRPA